MARPTRTDVEKQADSDTLVYEFRMMVGAWAGYTPNKTVSDNCHLESFAIHARAVLLFLYPPGKQYDTDVLVTDYLPAAKPRDNAVKNTLDRLNTEIAHMRLIGGT